jgi:hypothetical protein
MDKQEAQRKAKAVGQAHTVKEYLIQDAIRQADPTISNDRAWKMTMSLPPKSRGRRP